MGKTDAYLGIFKTNFKISCNFWLVKIKHSNYSLINRVNKILKMSRKCN